MLDAVSRKVISFWLTHSYLRRIDKRYPEYFKQMIYDLVDNRTCRKIMLLRYTGEDQLKFEAIAYEINMDLRDVFKYHKKAIDAIIG